MISLNIWISISNEIPTLTVQISVKPDPYSALDKPQKHTLRGRTSGRSFTLSAPPPPPPGAKMSHNEPESPIMSHNEPKSPPNEPESAKKFHYIISNIYLNMIHKFLSFFSLQYDFTKNKLKIVW